MLGGDHQAKKNLHWLSSPNGERPAGLLERRHRQEICNPSFANIEQKIGIIATLVGHLGACVAVLPEVHITGVSTSQILGSKHSMLGRTIIKEELVVATVHLTRRSRN